MEVCSDVLCLYRTASNISRLSGRSAPNRSNTGRSTRRRRNHDRRIEDSSQYCWRKIYYVVDGIVLFDCFHYDATLFWKKNRQDTTRIVRRYRGWLCFLERAKSDATNVRASKGANKPITIVQHGIGSADREAASGRLAEDDPGVDPGGYRTSDGKDIGKYESGNHTPSRGRKREACEWNSGFCTSYGRCHRRDSPES